MTAHPRSRGENAFALVSRANDSRLIPAHAGKTGASSTISASSTAHPRSRGENDVDAAVFQDYEGSSPLTRGKRDERVNNCTVEQLIPAHAGKTI